MQSPSSCPARQTAQVRISEVAFTKPLKDVVCMEGNLQGEPFASWIERASLFAWSTTCPNPTYPKTSVRTSMLSLLGAPSATLPSTNAACGTLPHPPTAPSESKHFNSSHSPSCMPLQYNHLWPTACLTPAVSPTRSG